MAASAGASSWSGSSGGSTSSQGRAIATAQTGQDERLVVAVRVRPSLEAAERCIEVISGGSLLYDDGSKNRPRQYSYDHVFRENDTQEQVYKTTTAPLVRDVLSGFNAAVFAYGATGSGKTHTMLGPVPRKKPATSDRAPPTAASGFEPDVSSQDIGLMVRAIEDIFAHIESVEEEGACKVSISYLEIYNELIRDLLNPGGPLELREDNRGQRITVAGLSEITTSSRKEVVGLLLKGNKARTMEPTAANQTSSRSHALLSIMVKTRTPLGTKQGRLFLTDLAGSERAKKTKNRGKRLQEGAHINRSLLALGNCINALSGGARYVNYRDSKLTRLLKEALSGRCKTVMIAHVAPESKHRDETKNTLVYADRANSITTKLQNSVYIDEFKDFPTKHYQSLVSELRDEVSRLRTKMLTDRPRSGKAAAAAAAAMTTATTTTMATATTASIQQPPVEVEQPDDQRKTELRYLREQIVLTFKQQMKLRRKLLEAESHLLGLELDAERQHMIISHWQGRIGKLYDAMGEDDVESEGSVALKNAWGELAAIEKENRRYKEIRERTEQELEQCRQKGVKLEDELPERISSDEERELLALLCRVHELEADKVSLQAERLARQAELRRRDLQLLRAERQRRLCEDIISSQRRLIEEGNVDLPDELRELYGLYQQEIHAGVVTPSTSSYEKKLPPIYTAGSDSPGSSSSSEWSPASPLPPIEMHADPVDRVMGPPVNPRLPRLSTGTAGGPRRSSLRMARNTHTRPHP
ncbi:kinesin-like protein KIF19 [Drosophila guanche]|uniref:Blast:Kinesin-like protein KIF19 n=1 Tax=Drosophila guanche TaxID=7266 RepID=A0A3B0KHY8_DROGU|nr:kinesin-like protein KIF19 [Drosophila guanche]XP_034137445.1 kinesin-like protein KIF19 [Drosophila guanche]SPP88090.1 blast:Kinesin-like protein KIF19 [Drosophila guanche]